MPALTAVLHEDTLPDANVLPAEAITNGTDYVHIPNVPVFKEHTTTARDGRTLEFTPDRLQQLCDSCNRRIEETGDFAAVVVRHTPESPDGEMPNEGKAIGYAGPFQLGQLGAKTAILADFHIRREFRELLKVYPRRSAELWLANDYGQMYFDPICLLGAEAPRLDLGPMPYSKRRHPNGELVEVYCAAVATGTSSYIPSTNVIGKRKERYEADPDPEDEPMTEQDLQQLIAAIKQTDEFQWIQRQMAAKAGAGNADMPGDDGMPDAMNQPEPDGDETPPMPPAAPAAGGADEIPPADPDKEKDMKMGAEKYAKQFEAMETRIKAVEDQAADWRAKAIDAERLGALKDLRREHAFDLDAMVEKTRYSKMSDPAAFKETCEHLTHYPKVPKDEMLRTFDLERLKKPEKFSEAHRDLAMKHHAEQMQAGKQITWEECKKYALETLPTE